MLALEIGKIYKKRQTNILQNLRKSVAMYIYEYDIYFTVDSTYVNIFLRTNVNMLTVF